MQVYTKGRNRIKINTVKERSMPVLSEGYPMHTPNVTCPHCDHTGVDVLTTNTETTEYVCRACGHKWEEYDD